MFSGIWKSKKAGKAPDWSYPELPSPNTDHEYLKVAIDCHKMRTKLVHEKEGWELYGVKDGAKIETKKVEGSNIKLVRASRRVDGVNLREVVDFFFDPTFEKRKKLYEELISYEKIKVIDDILHVSHSKFGSPFFGVSGRDFLTLRYLTLGEKGNATITVQSINSREVPFDSNSVRGVSNCAITFIPQKDGPNEYLEIISIDFIDPKGSVPSWIINSYLDKAGKRLWGIEQLFGPNRLIDQDEN